MSKISLFAQARRFKEKFTYKPSPKKVGIKEHHAKAAEILKVRGWKAAKKKIKKLKQKDGRKHEQAK